jgi:hypothetical protein
MNGPPSRSFAGNSCAFFCGSNFIIPAWSSNTAAPMLQGEVDIVESLPALHFSSSVKSDVHLTVSNCHEMLDGRSCSKTINFTMNAVLLRCPSCAMDTSDSCNSHLSVWLITFIRKPDTMHAEGYYYLEDVLQSSTLSSKLLH